MNKRYDWMAAFDRFDEIKQQLSGATSALSKLAESISCEPLLGYERNAIDLTAPIVTALERFQQLDNLAVGAAETTAKLLDIPAIQERGDWFSRIEMPGAVAALNQLSKTLKMYKSPSLITQMERALEQWSVFDDFILSAAKSFMLPDIEIKDEDVLSFGGKDYTPSELAAEFDSQISEVQEQRITLREKYENLTKKWWLLLLVLNLILAVPEIPEKVEFYENIVSQIQEVCSKRSYICFTIRERSILREEPNTKSKRLFYLLYDTPLEIIDNIPRWYQVKYTDENGEEIIGWISKISVESEE